MKKLSLVLILMAVVGGGASVQAAEAKGFLVSVEKSMKISGQMASGKVPYNSATAVKEMKNIQNAVKAFETSDLKTASKDVVRCAAKLKTYSAKGAVAAKAGYGAFKSVYGNLLNGYKDCKK